MEKKVYKKKIRKFYSRKITASLPKGVKKSVNKNIKTVRENLPDKRIYAHFPRFILVFLMILFVFLSIQVGIMYFNYLGLSEEKLRTRDNYLYWQEVASKHPNSPDAYYNAGKYAYSLGELASASKLLNRAIELDPSFDDAIKLEDKVQSNQIVQ